MASPQKPHRYLTRFDGERMPFKGWRLCHTRKGVIFCRYFTDRQFESSRSGLAAAKRCLAQLMPLLDGAKLVRGKLPADVVKQARQLLKGAS